MNIWDVVIIVVIVALVLAAVLVIRRRKQTGCSCGCEGCMKSCDKRKKSRKT